MGTKWAIFRGPSIDASYQVSVHLAQGFQRRRLKCEELTDNNRRAADNGCQVMAKVKKQTQQFTLNIGNNRIVFEVLPR